jgi:hypothetical protein
MTRIGREDKAGEAAGQAEVGKIRAMCSPSGPDQVASHEVDVTH